MYLYTWTLSQNFFCSPGICVLFHSLLGPCVIRGYKSGDHKKIAWFALNERNEMWIGRVVNTQGSGSPRFCRFKRHGMKGNWMFVIFLFRWHPPRKMRNDIWQKKHWKSYTCMYVNAQNAKKCTVMCLQFFGLTGKHIPLLVLWGNARDNTPGLDLAATMTAVKSKWDILPLISGICITPGAIDWDARCSLWARIFKFTWSSFFFNQTNFWNLSTTGSRKNTFNLGLLAVKEKPVCCHSKSFFEQNYIDIASEKVQEPTEYTTDMCLGVFISMPKCRSFGVLLKKNFGFPPSRASWRAPGLGRSKRGSLR